MTDDMVKAGHIVLVADRALLWTLGIAASIIVLGLGLWARRVMDKLGSIDVRLESLVRLEERHESQNYRIERIEQRLSA